MKIRYLMPCLIVFILSIVPVEVKSQNLTQDSVDVTLLKIDHLASSEMFTNTNDIILKKRFILPDTCENFGRI